MMKVAFFVIYFQICADVLCMYIMSCEALAQAHVVLLIQVYPTFQPLSSPSPGQTIPLQLSILLFH